MHILYLWRCSSIQIYKLAISFLWWVIIWIHFMKRHHWFRIGTRESPIWRNVRHWLHCNLLFWQFPVHIKHQRHMWYWHFVWGSRSPRTQRPKCGNYAHVVMPLWTRFPQHRPQKSVRRWFKQIHQTECYILSLSYQVREIGTTNNAPYIWWSTLVPLIWPRALVHIWACKTNQCRQTGH